MPDKRGFTLAEVLITLVIIGIIAAITVPMIHANYKKQETVSKLKKAYSTLSQVVNRSIFDNGPVDTWYENGQQDATDIYTRCFKPYLRVSSTIKDFNVIYEGKNPYLNLNGVNSNFNVGTSGTSRVSFQLEDGTFILISTIQGTNDPTTPTIVVEPRIYIDINSSRNPNQFGKDVFVLALDKNKGLVPFGFNAGEDTLKTNCSRSGNGQYCLRKIMRDGWEIKPDYPW